MDEGQIRAAAARGDDAVLVLELLKRLCTELGIERSTQFSPTAPPGMSTPIHPAYGPPVDKSGVPTTTSSHIEDTDDGE